MLQLVVYDSLCLSKGQLIPSSFLLRNCSSLATTWESAWALALFTTAVLFQFFSLFKLQKTKQLDKPKTAAAFTRWERLLTLKLSKLKKLWKYLKKKHCGAEKIEKDQVIIPH